MDPFGEARAAIGFGLSRLLSVYLHLGKSLLPSAHLEPVVRETDLAARVVLNFFDIVFDRLQQVIGLKPSLHPPPHSHLDCRATSLSGYLISVPVLLCCTQHKRCSSCKLPSLLQFDRVESFTAERLLENGPCSWSFPKILACMVKISCNALVTYA